MEEARRAMEVAEQKLSENDYDEAKKLVKEAQSLYPKLDGLKQMLMMIDVYISAKGGQYPDYYGVLGVDSCADDEALKKQYKKLALLLHPDKNKFNGAEGAFKLVSEALSVLSDKPERAYYDRFMEWIEFMAKLKKQKEEQSARQRARAEENERIRRADRSPNQQKPSSSKKHSAYSRQRKGDRFYDFMYY